MSSTEGPGSPPIARLPADVARLRSRVAELRTQVETADASREKTSSRAAWTAARDQIRAALLGVEPRNLLSSLDAHVPLVLLPVRLETRFGLPGTNVLHVRIFPDQIHVDGHDPALTETEAALGGAFWAAPADLLADGEPAPTPAPAPDTADGRRARWAALVRLLGGPRAAWVARATRPGTAPPATKAQAYVRPPVARALPDRWLVRAYVGDAVVGEAWAAPVGVDLHLAPDPQASLDGGGAGESQPAVDPELRWMVDYGTAVSAGMAVDVPLRAGTSFIDRVVAVGVRASSSPADAVAELGALLTAHRYTDGLGFLPAGSATSNTPDARSAVDRQADPDALWHSEFGPAAGAGTAASNLASALGLPGGILDGSTGSDDAGDARARAMQTATWAATWGYYLDELLDSAALPDMDVDAVRDHYLRFVRGRGTLPVLRLGRQPYGVLPLASLARWTPDGASPMVDALARLLIRIRPLWQHGVGTPVTASEGPGFDEAFSKVMSTDAVARSYAIRTAIGDRTFDPDVFTGIDAKPGHRVIDALVGDLLGIGRNPLVLDVFSPTAQPVRAPLVVDPRDPAPDATVQTAIRRLAAANPGVVLIDPAWLRPHPKAPPTLLHTLLRRSLLLEYAAAGVKLGGLIKPVTNAPALSAAPPAATSGGAARLQAAKAPTGILVGMSPDPHGGFTPINSLPSIISTPLASVTGGLAAGEWLWRNPREHADLRRNLDQTLQALALLAKLTAEELELLLPETLDLATHRWTAWAESVAAEKLARLRAATPTGLTIGGWGIVERLARRPRVAVDPNLAAGAATGALWEDVRPGGFVHAPSTAQAATAAVLRAAHLAHGGEDDPRFAVDLSSAPARSALRLAAGVRAGQELGALLGYELERDLHERSADVLIAPLRAYAPRWKASGTFVEGDAEQVVSPSAVVDGLALANDDPAAVARAALPVGASPALATALQGALAQLRRHQHALADLLTAEVVHQVLAGNTTRAAALLDAASRGGHPPDDFDVLRTPRSGTALTCRVGVLLPTADGPLPGDWPASPRGNADRDCAHWLAGMLPPLERIRLRVADAAGAVTDQALPASAVLGPLDLVLDPPEVVRTRIRLALPPGATLVSGRDPAWAPSIIGLDELLTLAGDLREVLAVRPLRRTDLLAPGVGADTTDERDAANLEARLAAARSSLQATADGVTAAHGSLQAAIDGSISGLGSALAGAKRALSSALAHGLTLHVPETAEPGDVLAVLGAASSELGRRLSLPAPNAGAPVEDLVDAVKGLLGAAQPAVPRLTLDGTTGEAAGRGLATGDGFLAAAPELAADWLEDVTAVRPAAERLAAAIRGSEALTAGAGLAGGWRIVEPVASSPSWTATFGAAELDGHGPVATLVAWAEPGIAPAAGAKLAGLLVDEWVEVVPHPTAATTIAYQAEAPTARAPQAVLLGLAPNVAAGWDTESVVDLAHEAAELAKLRLVDAESGAWLGRMLPAVLLPDGDAHDVIAAPPLPLLQVEASLLEAARDKVKARG